MTTAPFTCVAPPEDSRQRTLPDGASDDDDRSHAARVLDRRSGRAPGAHAGDARRLLRGLPDTWIAANEGDKTWSPFDVVGHLIHGERTDWIPRARIILEHGEGRAFDKFDRFAQFAVSKDRPLSALLDEFASLRRQNLEDLSALKLTEDDLDRRGTASGARRGHAPATALDVGGARSRSHRADLASAGQTGTRTRSVPGAPT